jgi:hypothetical protein
MTKEKENPFNEFITQNGHYLQSATAKMECVTQQINAFWGQKMAQFNPDVLSVNIKSLNESQILFLQAIRELQLYQIELKKFLGLVRREPNIDEGHTQNLIGKQEKETIETHQPSAPPPLFPV